MTGSEEVRYRALGVMSGSSLDGLDLALCTFTCSGARWHFSIDEARTLPYSLEFQDRLKDVMEGSALELARLDRDLGDLIGKASAELLDGRAVDVIASHGHTVFHKPAEGLTVQIGHGARIVAITGCKVVTDFRTLDVALGGQGAPLVPLGEHHLFPDHQAFVNIGGICNIALHSNKGQVFGYDVCIGNQALNLLAEESGQPFDRDGALARSGTVAVDLLERLNALPFHRQPPPRSLGREWFQEHVVPLITDATVPLKDRSCTVVEHIATTLSEALGSTSSATLVTGGGAHNGYLMERLRHHAGAPIEVPDTTVVDYKEALIFAFLGVRRLRNERTALASVTGARRDSSGGSVF